MPDKGSPESDDLEPNTDRSGGARAQANPPLSRARPMARDAPLAGSDTLLSVPNPEASQDLGERVALAERRLAELERRVAKLENRPAEGRAEQPRSFWPWLVFLAALAVVWQVLALIR